MGPNLENLPRLDWALVPPPRGGRTSPLSKRISNDLHVHQIALQIFSLQVSPLHGSVAEFCYCCALSKTIEVSE